MSSSCRPTVSVVIPVHDGGTMFRKCLQNLAASNLAPEEIIVVSDGDSDGSWRVAEEFDTQVLRIPTRGGPPGHETWVRASPKEIFSFFSMLM